MIIRTEESLRNFKFWSGAKDVVEKLTVEELDSIEILLEEEYPEGITDTELNDMFWFEADFLLSCIGLTEEEILEREI